MFFWGVTQQQRPKWGSGLVSLLRGPIPQWAGGCRSTAPAFEGGGKQPRSSSLASSPPMSARSALVPTAVLLSLLAVAGSARLVYALWRRREGKGTQGCHCAHPGHSGTHLGS